LGSTEIFEVICGELAGLARVHDYGLLWGGSTFPQAHGDTSVEEAEELCEQFIQRKVAGVFFAPFEHTASKEELNHRLAERLRQAGIAVVLLDRDLGVFPNRSEFDLIGIDNFTAGYLVADHLIKLGCRTLSFLTVPLSAPTVAMRISGAREALLDHGLAVPAGFVVDGEPEQAETVHVLTAGRKADAVICQNDRAAALLLRTLAREGVRVPQEVRVVGFDDVKYTTLLPVPLTTVHQPCREIAVTAFRAMLDRIADPALPARGFTLSPRLVVRESCGAYLRA
jgi:LacI family transcriptional regulator